MEIFKSEKTGVIDFIRTNISFDSFKNNTKKFNSLMNKLTDEFLKMQLYNGEELLEYGKKNDIYDCSNHLLFKHSKGTALIRVLSFGITKDNGYSTSVSPEISISTTNFLRGFSFNTGLFADVYLTGEYTGFLSFSTRDTIDIHNLYLHWVISKLEEQFDSFEGTYEHPIHRDVFKILELTNPICLEFDECITKNKSKRIDLLVVDGKSVKEYIKEHIKYKYVHSEADIYKCCMIYKKPYNQIKSYLDKVLD